MIRHSAALLTILVSVAISGRAAAHCDTTKGPVVAAARAALEADNPTLVLHWVRTEDEAAVRAAFAHTMKARALGPEAKAKADRAFFETVVRIHRAGEGASYTGLTDADPEPIIAATDRALAQGAAGELEARLVTAIRSGLADRFTAARASKDFPDGDVIRGRAFVAAYVSLTHWVEAVFAAAKAAGEHHGAAAGHAEAATETVHPPCGYAASAAAAKEETHGPRLAHLPWILAGLFALAALVEAVVLVRHRRGATS